MPLPAGGEGVLAHIHLIYVGPLDRRHRVRELALAFLAARDHDPRLHLLIVGDGAERSWLEGHLGPAATFLDQADPGLVEELAERADLLVSPTTGADTATMIAIAQREGVPVLAVDGGEAAELIESGRSGFLVPDDPVALTDAIRWLSRRATLRQRLATGGRVAAGARLSSGPERIIHA
ncbi:MAG TPA: glycosyltransferase [Solirubrobacteraceae bacterium]|nr:glycosyltransferase [Solirubrobacteraceae bacterium]